MAFTIPTIFSAVDKLTAPVRRMSGSVQSFAQKAEAGMARLDRRLNKLVPSFGQLGKQMLAFAGTTAIIAGISTSVNIIKDYEQANANLASIMGTTVEANILLAKDAERLGAITAKSATEVVGLQEAYARLGFAQGEIVNVTEATINGSIAMNAELSQTAELTGAMIRTFDSFSSIDAPQILDQMTLATQKSALNFEKLNTALPIVSGAANAAGVPFDNLLALLGKLSDAGIDASSSSTALRNIFLDSAKKGHSYSQILQNIQKNQDKLTAANDEFGKRGAVSATILASNISQTEELTKILASAAKGQENSGVAAITAAKQLDTTTGALTLLASAWEGVILKINSGTGAMKGFRTIIEFVTKNLETIVMVAGVLVGGFLALKLVVFTYSAAMKIAAAAQWLLNVAMNANPIGLVIMGIVALIAVVAIIVKYWDSWGASIMAVATTVGSFFLKFLGPLGFAISLVVSLYKNWGMITDAFKNGGIISGIKAIGAVILDVILYPIQQILELIAKIPGMGGIAGGAAESLASFRGGLGLGEEPAINNRATEQANLQESITTNRSVVDLNVNDPNNRTSVEKRGAAPGVNLTSTLNFQ